MPVPSHAIRNLMSDRAIRYSLAAAIAILAGGGFVADLHALATGGARCAWLSAVRPLCHAADR